jgi:membrane fusion protein, multidrug efflux system
MTSWFGPTARAGRTLPMRAVLVFVALFAACDQAAEAPANTVSAPPPAVTVLTLRPTEVTPGFSFNGRVVAVDEVQLRARVTGFLEQRLFEEGADVDAGDLLFVIEKAPYQAMVEQRRAELESAEANRANTALQLQRGEELVKNKNIAQAEVDQRRAADQMAAAKILQAQAALKQAQLNLGYTEIRAPIAGRISRADFSSGNLVGPDSGALAIIVSQDPIYVTFPVSQRQLLAHRGERRDPVVRVNLPDGTLYEHPGKLNFLDVQVDPGTDTHGGRRAAESGPYLDRWPVRGRSGRTGRARAGARGPAGGDSGQPGGPVRAGRRQRRQGGGTTGQVRRIGRRSSGGRGWPE